jgi:hypothetical protein
MAAATGGCRRPAALLGGSMLGAAEVPSRGLVGGVGAGARARTACGEGIDRALMRCKILLRSADEGRSARHGW